jgi:MYXO-CTERM domain-containing protein
MKRPALVLATLAATGTLALALSALTEGQAAACGGCFQPPVPPNETQNVTDITDERMLLTVSPAQTTLYDQIIYSGNPASFAWVLPIRGTVTVGLSADVLFDSVDAVTATQIVSPVRNCPPAPNCGSTGGGCGSSSSATSGLAFNAPPPGADGQGTVTVTKQQNVGPYETVQLASTTPMALETWLAANGFDIPTDVQPVIAAYQKEGFDFLAMKLLPNQGVQAMRPVRVTSSGASLTLPLRMASIGTGATVGITIWVVADGRYEPQNFPFFHIDDSELVWDWTASASNYTTLRQTNEAQYGGKGWEIESSVSVAQQTVVNVIQSGGVYSTGPTYGGSAGSSVIDASQDYAPITDAQGNVTQTATQVRQADVSALFTGLAGPNATFTRMRSDVAHAAMTVDFVVQASADQSQLSNVRNVTQEINLTCPVYGNDCQVIGNAPAAANTSGTSGGTSCATTSAPSREPISLAAVVGLLAFAALRPRRRR